ncbi:glutamate--tRNA ligase [Candidatus Wolfebacteria bacterium]|nr:glutamate--tRNA ligase [Candidatus Wolfebacteria bacterium]
MTRDSLTITRFPPSPTGYLHIGRARTALFNFLFTKHYDGKMIFRLEDTDKARSKKEFEKDIVEGLDWLGITYDEGPFRQSERTKIYQTYLRAMIEKGSAYEAEDSNEGEGKVVRLKNPNTTITFTDLIRGDIVFNTTELGDFVIARNINEPLYHLAVVVDDFEMEITHVIRGEDGISNTPRQILLQEAIGASRPVYAHIPFILAPDKSKLSGRHGAVSLKEYREAGYLPEALVNYLALLGWHPTNEREIFSMEELIKEFDLSRVQKGGAVFDEEKLKSMNKIYIAKLSDDDFLRYTKKFMPDLVRRTSGYNDEKLAQMTPLIRERVHTFGEIADMAGELDYFFGAPEYNAQALVWKDDTPGIAHKHLEHIAKVLEKIPENTFTVESIKSALWDYATREGRGSVLWPMRYALSGKEKSPDPFTLAAVLGKTETLARLKTALVKLS